MAESQQASLRVVLWMVLLVISAFNYGYSDQSFAACQGMKSFIHQFGYFNDKSKTYEIEPLVTSLYNSLKAGSQLIGVFVGSWISDRFGPRTCLFVMNIWALGSASFVTGASTTAEILAGRTLHYVYLGMVMAIVPTTLVDLAPSRFHGAVGILYWLTIKVGGLTAVGLARKTSGISDNSSWRIVFGLILVAPSLVIVGAILIPESPQWLRLRGKQEEAVQTVVHLGNDKASGSELQVDVNRPSAHMQNDSLRVRKGFLDLFSPEHRLRTLLIVAINFFQQGTGQAFVSQYSVLFVKQLHTLNPWSVSVGLNATDIGALLICLFTIDYIGRRWLLTIGSTLQTVALFVLGGLGRGIHGRNDDNGKVAMLLLYSFAWSLGWAPITYLINADLPAVDVRGKTLCVGYTVKLVTEFAVTFSYPYLETPDKPGHLNLGGWVGFIYGPSAALSVLFMIVFGSKLVPRK